MEIYWVSTYKMTFGVYVKDKIVIDSAPIGRTFIGQPFENLERWLSKQGGYKKEKL